MEYGISEVARTIARRQEGAGKVSGADFPPGTIVRFPTSSDCDSMIFACKSKEDYIITKNTVKNAEIIAIGVIGQKPKGTDTVACYGIKYKIETTDGKTAIIMVEAGETQYKVEHIIF